MEYKIDNNKAIENIREYLRHETDAGNVVEALDNAYYLLAQSAASALDKADCSALCNGKSSLEDIMYNIHRLREVLVE